MEQSFLEMFVPISHPPYEAFYIHSMLFNTSSAIRSMRSADRIFDHLEKEKYAKGISSNSTNLLLDEFQNIVLQAGAISKYFWPSTKKRECVARSKRLKEVFQITDESSLCLRETRNSLEHFDEKLDAHLKNMPIGIFTPNYVGLAPVEDGVPKHFFRAFFVDQAVFCVLDKKVAIDPLCEEIESLHRHLCEMLKNGSSFKWFA